MPSPPILLSWLAINHDPFDRDSKTQTFPVDPAARTNGPTLTLLFDDSSPYCRKIGHVLLFYQASKERQRHDRYFAETRDAIHERSSDLPVDAITWDGEDPTDHEAIFAFMREKIPEIRKRFPRNELVIHVSPGTPSMHTVWVLMAETGFIERPFKVVKSYRERERRGRPAVMPVELGIDTFYKRYQEAHPARVSSPEQAVRWDPKDFRSSRMNLLFREARRIARVKVPVLIVGERGTGKTTLASWIRFNSPFRKEQNDASWPSVPCGQFTDDTMRSELFGHRKGAFTGALENREGLLARANGDTLFLDEIGDISKDLQRLLIRAVEEHRYLPLGESEARESDFRLITATNRPWPEIVEKLDADFLDRVSPFVLRLPPLREVPEDLDWLWRAVFTRAARMASVGEREARLGSTHHEAIMKALQAHPLPGNLRDLFRVAWRLLAARSDEPPASPGDAVDYALTALDVQAPESSDDDVARRIAQAFIASQPLDDSMLIDGKLPLEAFENASHVYLAREIRRMARERGVPVKDLCGMTDKTLGNWLKRGRKDVSEPGED